MIDNLIAQLNSEPLRKGYRYILLDMLGAVSELNDLYLEALKSELSPMDLQPVKRPELIHDLDSCPHLVCIGKPNQDINAALVTQSFWVAEADHWASKPYVCGWIASELAIDELSEQLVSIGEQLGELLSMRFVPFYEPFRLEIFQACSGKSDGLASLLKKGLGYFYLDSHQSLSALPFGSSHQADDRDLVGQNLGFFQRHRADLFQLYHMWYEINQQQQKPLAADALKNLLTYYWLAHQLLLTDRQDKNIFVLFSMQYGDLMRSEVLKAIIKTVIQHEPGQLAARFKLVDDEFQRLKSIESVE